MPQVLSYPAPPDPYPDPQTQHVLIYFVAGNPGLIDYYAPFLSTLRSLLDERPSVSAAGASPRPPSFHIYGRNLSGFDDADHAPFTAEQPPYGLEAQIQQALSALESLTISTPGPRQGTRFDRVVPIGHSVGAFITLELFHRRSAVAPALSAGILLFPAVTHLAQSPSGRRATALLRLLSPASAAALARGLSLLLPDAVLRWTLSRALGQPPHAQAATERLVRSRDGVWQAAHLAADELRLIGEATWGEELWEAAAAGPEPAAPKFFFLFGESDHWVADECRDRFIREREAHAAREGPWHKRGRTKIVVDEGGIPHAFCIGHSEVVAEKVKLWIDEIAEQS